MSQNNGSSNGYISNFIWDDGYTESAFIAAEPPLHGGLRFTYRPARPEERTQFLAGSKSNSEAENYRRCVGLIAKHVKTWDAKRKTDKGELVAVKCDAENIKRIKGRLHDRLLNIVLGYEAGDIDLEAPKESVDEFEKSIQVAAESGKSLPVVRAEADEKNS